MLSYKSYFTLIFSNINKIYKNPRDDKEGDRFVESLSVYFTCLYIILIVNRKQKLVYVKWLNSIIVAMS